MRTVKITKQEAIEITLEKRYGVIGDGCSGVWGEGDTIDDACADALKNQLEYAGAANLDGCWIVTLAH